MTPTQGGLACKGHTETELTSRGHSVTGRQEETKMDKQTGRKVTGWTGKDRYRIMGI